MSSASLLGPIMPPSVLMILYCMAVGRTSIAGLFMAAVVPAILISGAQIIIANRIAAKRGYKPYRRTTWEEKMRATKKALPALMLPVIILGGIFSGIFTITEASAVAVLYSGILAFFVNKAVKLKDIPEMFLDAASTTGLVLLLSGAGSVMAWAIANERVLDSLIGPMSAMPWWLFLLCVNVVLLVVGCFMDDYASIVILAPIIAPIAWELGIDPIHIGLVICVNLVVGLATPPFGLDLFVAGTLADTPPMTVAKKAMPFIIAFAIALFGITYVPWLSLALLQRGF